MHKAYCGGRALETRGRIEVDDIVQDSPLLEKREITLPHAELWPEGIEEQTLIRSFGN